MGHRHKWSRGSPNEAWPVPCGGAGGSPRGEGEREGGHRAAAGAASHAASHTSHRTLLRPMCHATATQQQVVQASAGHLVRLPGGASLVQAGKHRSCRGAPAASPLQDGVALMPVPREAVVARAARLLTATELQGYRKATAVTQSHQTRRRLTGACRLACQRLDRMTCDWNPDQLTQL